METRQARIDRHLKCFYELDPGGVLADYAADAVLFVPCQQLTTPTAIESFFIPLPAEFAKPGARFSVQEQSYAGDYGYILWSTETPDNLYESAIDTFMCRTEASRRSRLRRFDSAFPELVPTLNPTVNTLT